jgi:DNA repair photolyase
MISSGDMFSEYKLDKGRIVVSTGGGACPLACAYCYTFSGDFRVFPKKMPEEIVSDLSSFSNHIDLVQLGCDTELFLDQKRAVDLVDRLSYLRKDISFATKMYLSDRTIDSLADASKRMRTPRYSLPGTDNDLVAFVSLIGFETARALEPKAPSPERRIATIKRLYAAGIPTFVFVRPLLPSVSEDELNRLFDATAGFCDGYVVGKLYCDQEMLRKLGIGMAEDRKKMDWSIDQRDWNVLIDERISRLTDGKRVFSSSLDAVDAVRGKSFQEAIVEGMPGMVEGSSLLDSGFYSMRLAVPKDANHITVMAKEEGMIGSLVLKRNVFSGESFVSPDLDDSDGMARWFKEKSLIIDQPSNIELSFPRAVLLEDGRLFAHDMYLAHFDVSEVLTDGLVRNLSSALRRKDDFVRLCESLEDKVGLDHISLLS